MITINQLAEILGVSDVTIRRAIKDGKLQAEKTDNGTFEIADHDALSLINQNPKYCDSKVNALKFMLNAAGVEPKRNISDDVEGLQTEILKRLIMTAGTEVLEAFSKHLEEISSFSSLPSTVRDIENVLKVKKQPTTEGLVNILRNVISVRSHSKISVGEIVSGEYINEIFGRNPQQEGINFCTSSKELFVITKLGVDNPLVESSEYSGYWSSGKIYYEGKGKDIQEFKGSNLHLYRKYQVFRKEIKCKEGVPEYIHVFNKVVSNRMQYLGQFFVSDFTVIEHSAGIQTKTAILFELTPVVNKNSSVIDDNYIFEELIEIDTILELP